MSETIQDKEAKPLKIKKPSYKKIENKEYKIDLTKKPEDAVQESSTAKVDVGERSTDGEKVGETHEKQTTAIESKEEEIKSPITEIVEEKTDELEKEIKEAKRDEKVLGKKLPENIEKLVSFMEDTGGSVEDYVRLNADYSKVDNDTLLQEYYSKTKPHLDKEEINFLLEDKFSFDEDVDDEKEIKLKRLAAKEEIAKAKNFLEETKSKYYDEIKLRPGVTQDQQKAMDFFNRYNKEQQVAEKRHEKFLEKTNNLFSDEFEGFEFNLGEKKFNYKVQNTSSVVEKQSNLNTFVKRFLNNEGEVVDTVGYHKAMYAADNADTIANHFYEQGKADALKDVMAKSKNITNEPRPQANGDVFINGLKVRAITGADSSKLKFKVKNKNNN
jgi:hypothetical protein|tara:strand:+ start:3688 stop:4842 length:1155 start_codon:yes stop_codon:yes gene_type:complete